MRLFLIAALVCAQTASAQVFRDPSQSRPEKPAKAQEHRPFADPGVHDAQRERCNNLRRELRGVIRSEREAITTGAKDQFALRHQELLAQLGKAGC